MKITGRTSSITNAFVSGIVPCKEPSEDEIKEALRLLGLDANDLRCAYCGDKATEWDHLRPLVINKKPTGYITDIYNLVPSCGKCNQSKGNKDWLDWINSNAILSPKNRNIRNLDSKIIKLKDYERWGKTDKYKFENVLGKKLWDTHWKNHDNLIKQMREYQKHSDIIRIKILDYIKMLAR